MLLSVKSVMKSVASKRRDSLSLKKLFPIVPDTP